ncbi:ATP-binding cassette domain-containing protein [Altericista sp. CCNU0014]|uniref:ATP-binding cassette domain-containing protein n=1 Tax=Altericista sp. CCNU0014 TaxID=3082949 RepID=UPI00384FD057
MPAPFAKLCLLKAEKPDLEFALEGDRFTIGRASDNSLVLTEEGVLPYHAEITGRGDRLELTAATADAAVLLDGRPLVFKVPYGLSDGDIVEIGNTKLQLAIEAQIELPDDWQLPLRASGAQRGPAEIIELRGRNSLTLGRDPSNDTTIDHPVVARFQAKIELEKGSWLITDLNSSDGTFVNDRQILHPQALRPGDEIRIGPCQFTFNFDETLTQKNEFGNLRLDAVHLTRTAARRQVLLDDVSLSILPREFIAIVGVSGAGKTTLLDALSGFRPAQRGKVFANGHDLYLNFKAYRTELGYVPQDDIIHRDLTVYQALDFAARLRLPKDISKQERDRQIQAVLADLELTHRQHALVRELSGGQRKRVSIGVELLTKPSLFFLDEATSGLDPGTESQMMRLLRRLADQGRTVILITHATKNVMQCDLVVFLAKGGKVAFYGPPQEALTYFDVKDFDDIYLKLEEDLRSPQEWQQHYRQSEVWQRYVGDRQERLDARAQQQARGSSTRRYKPWENQSSSFWRQLLLLSHRNLTILWQDRASLILVAIVAPLLGLLDFVLWQRDIFDVATGDSGQALTLLFTSGLVVVIVGSLVTMREIVKESEIYCRERMVGLQILPYLLSKVWFCMVLALYQAAVLFAIKALAVDLPGTPYDLGAMYFTLFLAMLGGMIMGLLVSALSNNQNVAPLLTILFLVPQFTLAGAFLPLPSLGPTGQWMSQFTMTRWSYEVMVTISGFGRDVAQDPCWQKPEAIRQKWGDAEKSGCQCLGPRLFERCYFPGLLKEYNAAVAQPEPLKPKPLGSPPQLPDNLLDPEAAATLRNDFKTYESQVKSYRTAMLRWQDKFGQWKEKRGKAISSAEALLERVRKSQGGSYAVNIYTHWLKMGLLQIGMLGLLVVFQKRKDSL